MSDQIKVGDLVMVVRGHECTIAVFVGIPYTVQALHAQRNGGWRCPHCKETDIAPNEFTGAQLLPDRLHAIPLSWLKKIDPPALPEDVTRDEEITA
jgi:hypothetical protein